MPFADANRAQIRYIEESTFGVTPASGNSREVRLTSSSLTANKETVVSDELRADRMVSDIVEVSASSGGEINFEWSSGPQDEFLAAFLLSQWERPMTMDFWEGIVLSVTGASTIAISGIDVTSYLTNGRFIKLAGWVNPANNGYFTIASSAFSAGSTTITISESTLVAEAGTVYSRVYDANDVIVLNNTAISVGATGFDGNAGNPFAAAIAAGQLQVGQKIHAYVEDAHETGTVTFGAGAATTTITISDGTNTKALVSGTDFVLTGTATTDGAAFAAAVNAARFDPLTPIGVKAVNAAGVVTLTNLKSVTGGSIVETVDDANVTVVNFAGGVAGAEGFFTVTTLDQDLLTVSPAPATVAAGGNITIKGSHLKNPGVITDIQQRYFTIETAFADVGQYMVQDGMVVGSFSLEIATGAIVTGTIGFEGRETQLVQTSVLGNAPYAQLTSQPGDVTNATTDVGNLVKDGSVLNVCMQSLSLTGEASLRMQNCVGSKFPQGIGTGRFNLTGSMTVFFETQELFNDFINHETVSMEFTITDSEGMVYYFTIPSFKISQDEIAPGGIDQDVFEKIEFTAFRDPTTNTMFQIDRFSPNDAY